MRNGATKTLRGGFTLIETAVATVVVGMGVVALVHALAAGTRVNAAAQRMTRAAFLTQAVREWTVGLPFRDQDDADINNPVGPDSSTSPEYFADDLDDLMNYTFSPPRDGQGVAISSMANWSQTVLMEWRDPHSLSTQVPDGGSDTICITVVVGYQGEEVLRSSWFRFKRPDE